MDSKDTCPTGGSHKWVYDIVGEKSCTKCGLWKKVTSEVGYSPEKGDYGLGGTIGKKGSGFGKIAPNTKFVSFDKILALAKKLINAYTEKVLNWNFAARLGKTYKFAPWAPRFLDSNVVEKCSQKMCKKWALSNSLVFIGSNGHGLEDDFVKIDHMAAFGLS